MGRNEVLICDGHNGWGSPNVARRTNRRATGESGREPTFRDLVGKKPGNSMGRLKWRIRGDSGRAGFRRGRKGKLNETSYKMPYLTREEEQWVDRKIRYQRKKPRAQLQLTVPGPCTRRAKAHDERTEGFNPVLAPGRFAMGFLILFGCANGEECSRMRQTIKLQRLRWLV